MVRENVEMFVALLLVLYIAFAYQNVPAPVAEALASAPGKLVAAIGVFLAAMVLHPSVTLLLVLALVMSIPGVELYANPAEAKKKAPGKNIQARKAPVIDTESKLKKATISTQAAKPKPSDKPAPVADKKTEHFANPFGAY